LDETKKKPWRGTENFFETSFLYVLFEKDCSNALYKFKKIFLFSKDYRCIKKNFNNVKDKKNSFRLAMILKKGERKFYVIYPTFFFGEITFLTYDFYAQVLVFFKEIINVKMINNFSFCYWNGHVLFERK
ncbi:hypothetical protein RFI_37612, partial [Reticulomyxa filosa]